MSYCVHNATNKTVVLPDLKAEIKPRGMLDLEMVATRANIEISRDLHNAFKARILQLGKHTAIHTNAAPVKYRDPPPAMDEQKLAALIKSVIKEEIKSPDHTDIKRTVAESIDSLHKSIRDQINSIHIPDGSKGSGTSKEMSIDPEKLAEISQRSVEKISEGISSDDNKQMGKKHKLKADNLKNLADEI